MKIALKAVKFGCISLYEHIFLLIGVIGLSFAAILAVVGLLFLFLRSGVLSVLPFFVAVIFFGCLGASIIMFLVGLGAGFIRIALDTYDHDKSSVKRFFSSFWFAPRICMASVIYYTISTIGLIFFIIPGIIIGLRLHLFPYFIVDRNMKVIESLKHSYKATKNRSWLLIILFVLILLIQAIFSLLHFFSSLVIPGLLQVLFSALYGTSIIFMVPFIFIWFMNVYFYRFITTKDTTHEHAVSK